MLKLLYKIKINSKIWFHSILQLTAILSFGWYNDRLFEMAIIYLCFFVFRQQFEKQWHASTTWLCTAYTIGIFFIISLIAPPKELSLLLIVIFTYTINFVSFHTREYLDLKLKFSKCKVDIKKGMAVDKLKEVCNQVDVAEMQFNILKLFYCDRKTITYIAHKFGYSYDRIWQLKNETLQLIDKFYSK